MSVSAWKHKDLPQKQLTLNKKELDQSYPEHWRVFLSMLKKIDVYGKTLYDIGCGVGATYALLQKEKVPVSYIGLDFSEEMIATARSEWNNSSFFVEDFHTTQRDMKNAILYCTGLLDILPEGPKELVTLLSMKAPYVILNRINLASTASLRIYKAYDTIDCYSYTFESNEFLQIISRLGYEVLSQDGSCFLLKLSRS